MCIDVISLNMYLVNYGIKCQFSQCQNMVFIIRKFYEYCPNIVMQSYVAFNRYHRNDYAQNYDYMIINTTMIRTKNNYDLEYDNTTNVFILK